MTNEDACYFFGDYTPRAGFNHSQTNQLISNLKKHQKYRNDYSWKYKDIAIQFSGKAIAGGLNKSAADRILIVPIPPSKPSNHAEYDDRMHQVAMNAKPFQSSCLLSTNKPRDPAHRQDGGRSVENVYQTLQSHPELYDGKPICVLIDDVLTTGSSFKAAKRKISEMGFFEEILGIFVARCVWPKMQFDLLGLDGL
ncbi:MAG: hypothetical protein P0Y56_03540 [Candidatus Andeanibacterium colombiense]|uniref:Phosphoribosyltransferase n=1 Tax=Candidatus Andeanibacterium colombiense TaxID=3121345 RepID=A0AAJ5X7V5_9SPHN|nr:MAG: hypothetical protein P0Y56_03540 [Sphingomonadaceae bacterium]